MEVFENLKEDDKDNFLQQHIVFLTEKSIKKVSKASFTKFTKVLQTFETSLGETVSVIAGESVELGKRFYTTSNDIDLFAAIGEPTKTVIYDINDDGDEDRDKSKKPDKKVIEDEAWYLPISEPLYCPKYQPVEMNLMEINLLHKPSAWDRFGLYQLKSIA